MRSLIYETKTVRGFWLFRWFTETPKDRMAAAIDRTFQLADSGALRVPEGQPIPVEKFSEAVYLAEAPAHGGKPLLVFERRSADAALRQLSAARPPPAPPSKPTK